MKYINTINVLLLGSLTEGYELKEAIKRLYEIRNLKNDFAASKLRPILKSGFDSYPSASFLSKLNSLPDYSPFQSGMSQTQNQAPVQQQCNNGPKQQQETSTFFTECATYYDTGMKLPFDQAEQYCASMGMTCASARSKEENDLLSTKLTGCWLSGKPVNQHYTEDNNNWYWTGDNRPITCKYWFKPYEPVNIGGQENCLQIYYYGGWNSVNCHLELNTVCEMRTCEKGCKNVNVWEEENQKDNNAEQKVESSGMVNYFKGKGTSCVTFYGTGKNLRHQEALDYCKGQGLSLARPKSKAENDLLSFYSSPTWLGMNKNGNGLSYSGENQCSQCTFWDKLEPNGWNVPNKCPVLDFFSKWKYIDCDEKCKVVCEYRSCDPPCEEEYQPPAEYPQKPGSANSLPSFTPRPTQSATTTTIAPNPFWPSQGYQPAAGPIWNSPLFNPKPVVVQPVIQPVPVPSNPIHVIPSNPVVVPVASNPIVVQQPQQPSYPIIPGYPSFPSNPSSSYPGNNNQNSNRPVAPYQPYTEPNLPSWNNPTVAPTAPSQSNRPTGPPHIDIGSSFSSPGSNAPGSNNNGPAPGVSGPGSNSPFPNGPSPGTGNTWPAPGSSIPGFPGHTGSSPGSSQGPSGPSMGPSPPGANSPFPNPNQSNHPNGPHNPNGDDDECDWCAGFLTVEDGGKEVYRFGAW